MESTKEVLEHISRWTLDVNTRGQELPRGLTKIYGSARRLRDYLQRSLSAFPQPVLIDLSDDDENLLVGCFIHSVGGLDTVLGRAVKSNEERAVLEQKRKVLSEWALELATRLPDRVPSYSKVEVNTPTVRGVVAEIMKKISSTQDPDSQSASMLPPRGNSMNPNFGGSSDLMPETADPPRLKIQTFRSEVPAGEPKSMSGSKAMSGIETMPFPSAHRDAGDAAIGATPVGSGTGDRAVEGSRPLDGVLEVHRIRDPRLRSMVGLDLRAFERAWRADDSRLALVHLYSIFEAGVLDHALGRRQELGLQSNVESWSLEGILQKSLGDRLVIADRAQLLCLISGRSLIRPAIQLTTPLAVTPASLAGSIALVRRVFIELGLTGSGPKGGESLGAKPVPIHPEENSAQPQSVANPVSSGASTPVVWSGIWGVAAP